MQAIITNLNQLKHTVAQGQNASLITAPAIAKAASKQTVVILDMCVQKLSELEKRVEALECK